MRFALMGALALVCAAPAGAAVVASGVSDPGTIVGNGFIVPGLDPGDTWSFTLSWQHGTLDTYQSNTSVYYVVSRIVNGSLWQAQSFEGILTGGVTLSEPNRLRVQVAFPSRIGTLEDCFAPNAPDGVCYQNVYVSGFFLRALLNTDTSPNAWSIDAQELIASVPEPSTWATLLMGFGFVGAVTRKSRRSCCRP